MLVLVNRCLKSATSLGNWCLNWCPLDLVVVVVNPYALNCLPWVYAFESLYIIVCLGYMLLSHQLFMNPYLENQCLIFATSVTSCLLELVHARIGV